MAWILSNKKGSGGMSDESYLYPTGQVAINTGHIHTANTKVRFKACFDTCSFTEWGEFFGARKGNYENNAFCFFPCFRARKYGFCRTGQEVVSDFINAGDSSESLPLIFVPCIFEASGKKIEWYSITDPTNVKSITASNANVNEGIAPLALFTFNNATSANGWSADGHTPFCIFYWFEIYEGDVLEHRFVPAYHNDQWCLYDEVDETYLYDLAASGSNLKGHLAS